MTELLPSPDLNAWRLEYGTAPYAVTFDFGTWDTGYPFTKQVTVGAVASELGDIAHPLTDGIVMGDDFTRGRTLGFQGVHLDHAVADPTIGPWNHPLDLAGIIDGAWAAESLRHTQEAVAKLTNLDRRRSVYGRPRGYVSDLSLARRGWVEWQARFDTIDDRFYGDDRGRVIPLTITTTPDVDGMGGHLYPTGVAGVLNLGTRAAYPIITLGTAPGDHLAGVVIWAYDTTGADMWKLDLSSMVLGPPEAHDLDGSVFTSLTIDTRPWMRSVIKYGTAIITGPTPTPIKAQVPGRLNGTPMTMATIPPGTCYMGATASAGSIGVATVVWADTYGAL